MHLTSGSLCTHTSTHNKEPCFFKKLHFFNPIYPSWSIKQNQMKQEHWLFKTRYCGFQMHFPVSQCLTQYCRNNMGQRAKDLCPLRWYSTSLRFSLRICRERNLFTGALSGKSFHKLWSKGIPTNISANDQRIGDTHLLHLFISHGVLWSCYLHWITNICLIFRFLFFSFHCYLWDPTMPFCTRYKRLESNVFSRFINSTKQPNCP